MPAHLIHPVEPERVTVRNHAPLRPDASFVLYWMQQAQRSHDNPALEVAIAHANAQRLPVLVAFGVTDRYPGANARHMAYMLQGLADVAEGLAERGIPFAVRLGYPPDVALALHHNASIVVCDRGYLRHQRAWRRQLAEQATCRVEEIEGEVIVPVEHASDKREWAARTLRPKIWRHAGAFLVPPSNQEVDVRQVDLDPGDDQPRIDPREPDEVLARLNVDRTVQPIHTLRGGQEASARSYQNFLQDRFASYVPHRNQPQTDDVSHLSKALHFGHLSVVRAALDAQAAAPNDEALESFHEELIVRRELAINFVWYSEADYDRYDTLPPWARQTLDEHRHDVRTHIYDDATLESADTHDPYWNASMQEMTETGYMHNYMRMYWGKKILEWSATPEEGFERTVRFNDRYFLDGRDPNGYTGVAWCYGLHDRAWTEREVFGKIRYMNAAGLKRKADPDAYVTKVANLASMERTARKGE